MNCPYCKIGTVKPPKVKKWETPCHAHGLCLSCGRKPRAKVSWDNDGAMYISYSREKYPADPKNKKTVRVQKLFTEKEWSDLLAGRAVLTPKGENSILLEYI